MPPENHDSALERQVRIAYRVVEILSRHPRFAPASDAPRIRLQLDRRIVIPVLRRGSKPQEADAGTIEIALDRTPIYRLPPDAASLRRAVEHEI
jgi:hypothetical protein